FETAKSKSTRVVEKNRYILSQNIVRQRRSHSSNTHQSLLTRTITLSSIIITLSFNSKEESKTALTSDYTKSHMIFVDYVLRQRRDDNCAVRVEEHQQA